MLYCSLVCLVGRKNVEVELIYNPEIPVERVGQATLLNPPAILWGSTGFNWYNNNIHAHLRVVYYI